MALRLVDRWIWDSWYVWDGDVCHAFYLCASKGLVDPNRRHRYTSVGHATTRDLSNWEIQPDVLAPSDSPAFDSWTTWTGSVVKDDAGLWWMFYTGTSREDGGQIQRIGAATSHDLMSWTKVSPEALIEADPTWYELYSPEIWHDQAWRDPWVFKASDQMWHMLVTARSKVGDPKTRGVLGHAVSSNLLDWKALQPLSVVGSDFGQLEVFQYEVVDGVPLLVFCCGWRELSEERKKKQGLIDYTYSIPVNENLKDVDFSNARSFTEAPIYAGRLVNHPEHGWHLLGFWNEVDGQFAGFISNPIPVTADPKLGLILREQL